MIQRFSPGILLGLVSIVGNARSSLPNVPIQSANDKVQIVDAIKTMYVALTNDDPKKFHTIAAPSYYAFDGGKQFTGDALLAFIKELHATGNVYVWNVTDPVVHINGDVAWVTYINRGSIQNSSGLKSMAWLESAILHKENGTWLIQFFHSTRVP